MHEAPRTRHYSRSLATNCKDKYRQEFVILLRCGYVIFFLQRGVDMDYNPLNVRRTYFREVDTVQKNWGWFFTLGILMSVLGCAAIGYSTAVTVSSVFLTGLLLLGAGIAQIIHGFWAREWKGVLLSTILGIVYIVAGAFCTKQPVESAIGITLFIASFCVFAGVFKMLTSLYLQFQHYGWVFFNGLITFLLGMMIFNDWPLSGLWVIGLFIGVDLLLFGWAWILLALSLKR